MNTPVAFIVFNRPEQTFRVFEAIRRAQPAQLFIVADGPRDKHKGDVRNCNQVREIVKDIDWDCEVYKKVSDINLGCGRNVSEGLNWVFDQVEEAVILEDDCLPHPDFFRFCTELLNKYKTEERIMAIGGTNVMEEWKSEKQSYHFSLQGSVWGWASWRRAWKHFDFDIKSWTDPRIKDTIRERTDDEKLYKWRHKMFDTAYNHTIDTWDYQWLFSRLVHNGLTIIPSTNLISNIGFGRRATHTKSVNSNLAEIQLKGMSFPLVKNEQMVIDRCYEEILVHRILGKQKQPSTLKRKLKKIVSSLTSYSNL